MTVRFYSAAALVAAMSLGADASVADEQVYALSIKDHRFDPAEVTIPAETRVKLVVRNLDPTAEEFESYELNREKIIPGGKETVIYIGPVKAGRYPFFGEFNQDTAQGVIVAR